MQEQETPPRPSQLLRQCIDWNKANPPGTHVRYFNVLGRSDYSVYQTDGLAYVLGDHTAVVRLKFRSGCYALSHMQAIGEGEPRA